MSNQRSVTNTRTKIYRHRPLYQKYSYQCSSRYQVHLLLGRPSSPAHLSPLSVFLLHASLLTVCLFPIWFSLLTVCLSPLSNFPQMSFRCLSAISLCPSSHRLSFPYFSFTICFFSVWFSLPTFCLSPLSIFPQASFRCPSHQYLCAISLCPSSHQLSSSHLSPFVFSLSGFFCWLSVFRWPRTFQLQFIFHVCG